MCKWKKIQQNHTHGDIESDLILHNFLFFQMYVIFVIRKNICIFLNRVI